MINYHENLVKSLSSILPTYYELFLDSNTETPCISYLESNNYTTDVGDTIKYSKVSYTIKVWSNKVSDLQKYAQQIDDLLLSIGFERVSSSEMFDPNSTMGQKILRYETLFIEK